MAGDQVTCGLSSAARRAALILAAVFSLSAVASGAEKGWFGFVVAVDADGVSLNPTLRSITVQKVLPSSPAALGGITAGDAVVEVEGIAVAGAKADRLKAAMQKSVGETLHLKVRHGAADTREISLVAVAKPAAP